MTSFLKNLFSKRSGYNLLEDEEPTSATTTMSETELVMEKWYFEATAGELQSLTNLNGFEKLLLSKIVHIIRVGLHLHESKQGDEVNPIDLSQPGAKSCDKYIKKALLTWQSQDKFFPLRRTAPSLASIIDLLPPQNPISPTTIFRVCVYRTFGVGSESAIQALKKACYTPAVTEVDSGLIINHPDLKKIEGAIQSQGKGIKKISRPVYGQLQIARKHVGTMLEKFWDFAQEFVKEDGSKLKFKNAYEFLCKADIPTIRYQGLLAWLITSDLAEYKACQQPEVEDLAYYLGIISVSDMKRPALGPNKALDRVAKSYKNMAGSVNGGELKLDVSLTMVWRILNRPPSLVPWLQYLVGECKKAQGRPLGVIDLEHILCKIERYAGSKSE